MKYLTSIFAIKYTRILLGLTFLSCSILVNIHPVNSQQIPHKISRKESCNFKRVTPKKQTKKINKFGVSFQIPANYQTEIETIDSQNPDNKTISLLNPSHLKLLPCCERNQLAGCGHEILTVVVNIEKTPPEVATLDDIPKNTSAKFGIIKNTKIANQSAIMYYVIDLATEDKYIHASFFTPNKKRVINIYYPENYPFNQQVFNTVISSFKLTE